MSVDAVKAHLKKYGMQDRFMEFSVSSATVELAAAAIGCTPGEIAKTLAFYLNEGCLLIVAAGNTKIDNKKFKETFGVKAKMLQAQDVLPLTGHPVGGVCPFAAGEKAVVYLDESLKEFDFVYPACGAPNNCGRFTPQELEEITQCLGWVDVCKGKDVE